MDRNSKEEEQWTSARTLEAFAWTHLRELMNAMSIKSALGPSKRSLGHVFAGLDCVFAERQ